MDSVLEKVYGAGKEDIREYEQHLMVGSAVLEPVLVRGSGVRVEDADGNWYIDCTSQCWAMYLGYSHQEVLSSVNEHMSNLTHVHQGFNTKIRYCLAKRLAELAPGNLNRVSFSVGGGPAVEAAMKIAMKNRPGSAYFVSQWDAYHGTTLGVMGSSWVSTMSNGRFMGGARFLPLQNAFVKVPNPYCYRCYFNQQPESCDLMCAKMLRLTLEKGVNGPAAGVIVEPIQASAGQIPSPQRYLKEIRNICDEFGVPLIFDEIQTYMRIGHFFAADYYDVEPDIIVLGKGLGGGFPLAAIIIGDHLEGFSSDVEELHTFANSSVGQVAALKQIEIVERDSVLDNVRNMGLYVEQCLRTMQKEFPEIGDIRAIGLHVGVELVNSPQEKVPLVNECVQIRNQGIKNGVIFGLGGAKRNVLKIKPPLIVSRQEVDEIISRLYVSMKQVLRT